MGFIGEWKDNYVVRQVRNLKLPEFKNSETTRQELVFKGKVQKVGFRLEVFELANRLELTGWVENLEDGSVRAQLQGGRERIDFLVGFMKSLKRARVDEVITVQLVPVNHEKNFIIKE